MTVDHLLPPLKDLVASTRCGICDLVKQPNAKEFLVCPHCDVPCNKTSTQSCGICRAGMKGLSDRGEL